MRTSLSPSTALISCTPSASMNGLSRIVAIAQTS
jgi:hypothetical protein